jgi:hypothetical protein
MADTYAMSQISSRVMFPECRTFFSFFRSRGGSLRALMTRAEAEGTTEATACRFWMVSWTVTLSPFQSPVALAMSSPTFLGDCWGVGTLAKTGGRRVRKDTFGEGRV